MTRNRNRIFRDLDLTALVDLQDREPTLSNDLPERRRDPPGPVAQHVITYLMANPAGTKRLTLAEEGAEVSHELEAAPYRDDFRLEVRAAVTPERLFHHLNALDPSVLSFSGHGTQRGWLLQDAQGGPVVVQPHALAKIVRATAPNARVAVMNGCWSVANARALLSTVDVAVGMTRAIGDDAARAFACRFFAALGHRKSIGTAFDQGVAMLALKDLPDQAVPVLLARSGVDPHDFFLPVRRKR